MSTKTYDIAIIGGGIVGMATAMALTTGNVGSEDRANQPGGPKVVVLEAEENLAAHQTGHNSGVIHSGLYYKPGSLKARNCTEGRLALYRFCAEHGIAHEQCGKVVVATTERELPALETLEKRGQANGLDGIRRLSSEEILEYEPHTRGVAGLFVPQTGIVDYKGVTRKYAEIMQEHGGQICTNARVTGFRREGNEYVLQTPGGEVRCRNLINCAGLQSDRVAKLCGVNPGLQIVPFRGEYYDLVPEAQHLVKNLIYPVPDARFPFLGVHFTRMVLGGVEAGPNAVLAFRREGYKMWDISMRDMITYGLYPGFWLMALKYWKIAVGEFHRSLSKAAFVKSLQSLIPELKESDVHRSGAGVRAQALEPNGFLADDFRIKEGERMIHVLNAPSPAATASISIGKSIARMALKNFSL